MNDLQAALSPRIAPVVLANISTRYPYHDAILFRDGDLLSDPTLAHPAFGNSFDWHSSVHMHWTATQLLSHFASQTNAPPIAARLCKAVTHNLTEENITVETAYLAGRPNYERPYGWAWALMLAAAVDVSPVETIRLLREPMRRLADQVADHSVRWLAITPSPVRHGVHGNTAFALGLLLDASRSLGFTQLQRAIEARALEWFVDDGDYPHAWERSAFDFLSPGLAEADLMRRLLPAPTFREWWRAFLPSLDPEASILNIATVPSISDGQIVHLHGLNLSRAGALARIGQALGTHDLVETAERLYRSGIDAAVGNDYLSTHWLATFAWDAAASIDSVRAR